MIGVSGTRAESRRLSGLRAAVIVVTVVLVAQIVVVIVGAGTAARHARDSARDVFGYAAAVSVERAAASAQDARSLVVHVAELWEGGAPEFSVVRAALVHELVHSPNLHALSVTYPDGTFASAQRSEADPDTYTATARLIAPDGTVTWNSLEYDQYLAVTSEGITPQGRDPLEEAAFVVGSRATGATWTLPGLRAGTATTGVWLALPLRDGGGQLQAVVAADVRLDVLAAMLNELPESSAQAFLITGDRSVLAAPASFADQIEAEQTRTGSVATASSIGVVSDATTSEGSTTPVFGRNGSLITVEEAVPTDVAPWVVQLRGEPSVVSPESEAIAHTVRVAVVWMVAVILVMVAVLARMVGPLRMLRSDAEVDRLTGLNNRRGFERLVRGTIARSWADGRTVLVSMLDLDNFKALNDRLGHDEGDRALAVVANVLRSDVREDDLAVRWGGDEFLLVLAVDRHADLVAVVERVRAHVGVTLGIRFGTQDGLGATAGFTEMRHENESMRVAVARADAALVEGKRRGKGVTYGYGPAEVDPTPQFNRRGESAPEV